MTKGEARWHHVATLLCGASGLALGWMLYFVEPTDPFALANHPWQPAMKAAHVLTAPLIVFAVGLIWRAHVWGRIVSGFRARRKTGWLLLLTFAPMVVSGYGLQVTASELWREIWLWTHWIASGAWVLAYAVHQLSPRKPAKDRQRSGRQRRFVREAGP